jgi:20S proteasome alpha/beta subunit
MIRVFILVFLFLSNHAYSQDSEWIQSELTEGFMRSITKDQCIAKTVASLKQAGPDENLLKTFAGVTGDCVTWAKGTEKAFCESFKENYTRKLCSTNTLDARDCILLHTSYETTCMQPKYK